MEQESSGSDQREQSEESTPNGSLEPSNGNCKETESAADQKQDREIRELRDDGRFREWVALSIAAFGAVIALGSAIIAYRQWDVMSQQLADARAGSIEQSVKIERALAAFEKQATALTDSVGPATESAANTAKANVAAMIANARTDQRAWVSIIKVTGQSPTAGVPLDIAFTVANTGRSPALHTNTGARARMFPVSTTPTFNYSLKRIAAPPQQKRNRTEQYH